MAVAILSAHRERVTVPLTELEKLRRRMERAVEKLLAALDELDGDPDLEEQCEDEGAQCDDEGFPYGDNEGGSQASCLMFRNNEGRQTWPPLSAVAK